MQPSRLAPGATRSSREGLLRAAAEALLHGDTEVGNTLADLVSATPTTSFWNTSKTPKT